jgi:CHAD domain-containing protein
MTGAAVPTWNQVRLLARRHLEQLLTLQSEILQRGSAKAIHDYRVASRRMQQVLDLLYERPRPADIRRSRRVIRRSRRVLSEVRNCDVLLKLSAQQLARKQLAGRPAWRAYRRYLSGRRDRALHRAMRRLATLNLEALSTRLQDELASVPAAGRNDGGEVPQAQIAQQEVASLRARIREEMERAWARVEQCVADSREAPGTGNYHAVRIAAKRLRYLIEVTHELGSAGSGEILDSLRRLQRELGDWHDLEIMEEMLLQMLSAPDFLRDHLELAIQAEQIAVRNRRRKKSRQRAVLRMTQTSPQWSQLSAWVKTQCQEPLRIPPGSLR